LWRVDTLQLSQIYQGHKTLLIFVQNLPYFLRQIGYIKRFLDKIITTSLKYLGCLAVDAVAAGKENLYIGIDFF
jgi:hypothetical protein